MAVGNCLAVPTADSYMLIACHSNRYGYVPRVSSATQELHVGTSIPDSSTPSWRAKKHFYDAAAAGFLANILSNPIGRAATRPWAVLTAIFASCCRRRRSSSTRRGVMKSGRTF